MEEEQKELRILVLEDESTDAELMEDQLRKYGLAFISRRVDTRDAFIRELEEFKPDVILLDYKLADLDGMTALKIARKAHPEVPLIIVTGVLADIEAVDLLRAGAKDYVLKDRLARLAPAVSRALSEEKGIRARKAAEKAVKESEERLRAITNNSLDIIVILSHDHDFTIRYVSPSCERIVGYSPNDLLGNRGFASIHPADLPGIKKLLNELIQEPESTVITKEFRFQTKTGSWLWLEALTVNLTGNPIIAGILVNIRDVTDRKYAEITIKEQLTELQRWQNVTLGREDRTLQLKHEVNELLRRLNEPVRYPSAEDHKEPLLDNGGA